MAENDQQWKPCSSCKKPIHFSSDYYKCSVSTCTRNRTGLIFCSVACWDAHLPFARHRDAWAVDATAPSKDAWEREQAEESPASTEPSDRPRRRIIPTQTSGSSSSHDAVTSNETLVVVSRVKKAISEGCGMNTSQCAIDALTKVVLDAINKAVPKARDAERKTVMGRDF